jgi:hypothetical protein
MEITKIGSFSVYQVYLHLALDDAVSAFEETNDEVSHQLPLSEESVTSELTLLHYKLEQRRATALILAACCVEAVANLYIEHKASPDQFDYLKWANFIEKWTIIPSFFVPSYTFPKDGVLYQDLKRLNVLRNKLVHLKEEFTRGDVVLHIGSHPEYEPDEHIFVGRCRSLPERLLSHVALYDNSDTIKQVRMIFTIPPIIKELK